MRAALDTVLIVCALAVGCVHSPAPAETKPASPLPATSVASSTAPRPLLADGGTDDAAPKRVQPTVDLGLPPRPTEHELFGDRAPALGTPDLDALVAATKSPGILPRPPYCAAYTSRRASTREAISVTDALAQTNPAIRDAMLLALSATGPVRIAALRADFAPIECADAITDPELGPSTRGIGSELLVGLSVASKLARTSNPVAIDALKTALTGLRGYAWGLALVEAGLADLRAYDAGVTDRKTLGRDSILTAFAELARVGVLRDASVSKARARLAALLPAQRVDALDELLLPRWTPPAPEKNAERALANTPAYWFAADASTFKYINSYMPALAVGVPIRTCYKQGCADYARARLDLGRMYRRRLDFVEAAHAAKEAAGTTSGAGASQLLLALARDLAHGPRDAIDMMGRSGAAMGLDRTDALDALVAEGVPMSGMAAYDAAHLRSLSVPEDDTAPAYVEDVARRFEKSSQMLAEPEDRTRALERARQARAAAAARARDVAASTAARAH